MGLKEVDVDLENMTIAPQKLEEGKVKILIFDGVQGRVKETYAVLHGFTTIETVKGKVAKVKFEDSYLFNN